MKNLPYKRILLKLSGEILADKNQTLSSTACQKIALAIKALCQSGIQVAIVIGGGNIFRGIQAKGMGLPRSPADQMGMLATLINGLALQQALLSIEYPAHLITALECPKVAESYNWRRVNDYLDQNAVVIFAGGTGNPYFTTDTAAALRASEIHADVLFKATKVNGIYDMDPLKYPQANKYQTITYSQILADKLGIMDATSIVLCRESQIPIFVFNMEMLDQTKIFDLLDSQQQGTLVKETYEH